MLLQEYAAQPDPAQFKLEEVDISTDEHLVELYGIRIPVVKNTANEKEIDWPFDLGDISALF